jgi:hypothetical protein
MPLATRGAYLTSIGNINVVDGHWVIGRCRVCLPTLIYGYVIVARRMCASPNSAHLSTGQYQSGHVILVTCKSPGIISLVSHAFQLSYFPARITRCQAWSFYLWA